MSDISIEQFLPFFAKARIPVAFLVPTPTGYEKSIMDATHPVRRLLKESGIHDYYLQGQGQENKKLIRSFFVHENYLEDTVASLYRPNTKMGDPRIWFKDLKHYCSPKNLLALFIIDENIYVVNLSDEKIRNSLLSEVGFANRIVQHSVDSSNPIVKELLDRLKDIHNEGFIKGIGFGDHNVGDTLESCLGIKTNSSKLPDYKGIELKATRGSFKKSTHSSTLFSQVPDWKNSRLKNALQILNEWGYWSEDDLGDRRWNLYCTVACGEPNTQGLYLEVDEAKSALVNYGQKENKPFIEVVKWDIDLLKKRLGEKHKETFWIKAETRIEDGVEYFRYDEVLHTNKPNIHLLEQLFDSRIITLDYAMHKKPDGKSRDHGYLFRIKPENFSLLFPDPQLYRLGE